MGGQTKKEGKGGRPPPPPPHTQTHQIACKSKGERIRETDPSSFHMTQDSEILKSFESLSFVRVLPLCPLQVPGLLSIASQTPYGDWWQSTESTRHEPSVFIIKMITLLINNNCEPSADFACYQLSTQIAYLFSNGPLLEKAESIKLTMNLWTCSGILFLDMIFWCCLFFIEYIYLFIYRPLTRVGWIAERWGTVVLTKPPCALLPKALPRVSIISHFSNISGVELNNNLMEVSFFFSSFPVSYFTLICVLQCSQIHKSHDI